MKKVNKKIDNIVKKSILTTISNYHVKPPKKLLLWEILEKSERSVKVFG